MGKILRNEIGNEFSINSSSASVIESFPLCEDVINDGAPRDNCNALAPIILAFSNLVKRDEPTTIFFSLSGFISLGCSIISCVLTSSGLLDVSTSPVSIISNGSITSATFVTVTVFFSTLEESLVFFFLYKFFRRFILS